MATKNGVSITKLNKRIKELLPEPYHAIAKSLLDKLKQLDRNMFKLQDEINGLDKMTSVIENGSQRYTKKHPAIETHEAQQKLFNSTVKTLTEYVKSALQIEGSGDPKTTSYDKQLAELDEEFKS